MRAVVVAVIILIGWVFFISSKQLDRNRRIQMEISALESEAANIRRENETFAEKIRYFSSFDFHEQEAKKKLGLKKANETVAIVTPGQGDPDLYTNQDGDTQSIADEDTLSDVPNYKKWWKIFFE